MEVYEEMAGDDAGSVLRWKEYIPERNEDWEEEVSKCMLKGGKYVM